MGIVGIFLRVRERAQSQREQKVHERQTLKDIPYIYGLFALGVSSGLSSQLSLMHIQKYFPDSLEQEMSSAVTAVQSGQSLSQAIRQWEDHPQLRTLAFILRENEATGTSALSALDSMTHDAMNVIKRCSDAEVKKLPVKMLFPLVICFLPSFLFLSVIPTLINGFTSIDW